MVCWVLLTVMMSNHDKEFWVRTESVLIFRRLTSGFDKQHDKNVLRAERRSSTMSYLLLSFDFFLKVKRSYSVSFSHLNIFHFTLKMIFSLKPLLTIAVQSNHNGHVKNRMRSEGNHRMIPLNIPLSQRKFLFNRNLCFFITLNVFVFLSHFVATNF